MKKRPDWSARLNRYIDEVRTTPFSYGEHDCALFAAGAIEAMTGEDPAKEYRGAYGSFRQGLEALKEAGYGDHVAMARSVLRPFSLVRAQRGDIAVIHGNLGASLGVVIGANVMCLTEEGLMMFDLKNPLIGEEVYRV